MNRYPHQVRRPRTDEKCVRDRFFQEFPFLDESVHFPKRKISPQMADPYNQIVELIKGYKSPLECFSIGGLTGPQNAKYFLRASAFRMNIGS